MVPRPQNHSSRTDAARASPGSRNIRALANLYRVVAGDHMFNAGTLLQPIGNSDRPRPDPMAMCSGADPIVVHPFRLPKGWQQKGFEKLWRIGAGGCDAQPCGNSYSSCSPISGLSRYREPVRVRTVTYDSGPGGPSRYHRKNLPSRTAPELWQRGKSR